MSYEKVKQASKTIIGTKQAVKAIKAGRVKELIVAQDAEERITEPVIALAKENGIPVDLVESRKELGKACGIQVGAAVVAIVMSSFCGKTQKLCFYPKNEPPGYVVLKNDNMKGGKTDAYN